MHHIAHRGWILPVSRYELRLDEPCKLKGLGEGNEGTRMDFAENDSTVVCR